MEESFSRIDTLLDERADELVRVFYDDEVASGYTPKADFAGESFTTLGDTDPNAIEPEDLIAVHLLGMTFRPSATKALIEDRESREEISGWLAKIPTTVDIWSEEVDFGAANQLWELIAQREKRIYRGVGGVVAGKLLARKRPRLIPIIDDVVMDLVPKPDSVTYWDLYRDYLRLDGRLDKVERLRPEGLSRDTTPTLRLLDTAIWIRGSRGEAAKEVRRALDLPDLR
jgi:hypothetical protein